MDEMKGVGVGEAWDMIHAFFCKGLEGALLVHGAFLPWRVTAVSVGASEGAE